MLRQHRTDNAPRRTAAAVLATAALGVALLAGCSASGQTSTSSAGTPAGASSGAPAEGRVSGPDAKAADAGTTSAATQAELQRKLTRQADISLTVRAVDHAAADIRSIAVAAGGLVMAEQLSAADATGGSSTQPGRYGTITISVPSERLDATLDQVSKLGTVESRTTSTQDVTSTYVDTQSRLATMRASVARVRALMSKATKIGDVVAIESELSRREADLESLQAQLNALDSAVAMSPVAIRLATPETAPTHGPSGFLEGLQSGWDAFTSSVVLLLTALGALLPFAVAGAVVLVPLAVWVRRRRPQMAGQSSTNTSSPSTTTG